MKFFCVFLPFVYFGDVDGKHKKRASCSSVKSRSQKLESSFFCYTSFDVG